MSIEDFVAVLNNRHSHWLSVAKYYGSTSPLDDIQDAYVKVIEYINKNGINEEHHPDGLMFFCLRSVVLQSHKNNVELLTTDGKLEVEEDIYVSPITDEEIDAIYETLDDWQWFDRTLIKIYFDLDRKNEGMSMRRIASETGISLSTIFNSIKRSKQKIKNRLENGKEQ